MLVCVLFFLSFGIGGLSYSNFQASTVRPPAVGISSTAFPQSRFPHSGRALVVPNVMVPYSKDGCSTVHKTILITIEA